MIEMLQKAAAKAADILPRHGISLSCKAVISSRVLAAVATALILSVAAPGLALAQNTAPAQSTTPAPDGATTVATHADWTVRCGANPQTQEEVCYMVQQVTSNDTGRAVLQVAIGKFGPDKRDVALVTLPLGVRLPPGIAIEVTGQEQRKRPFERCLRVGCQAQLALDAATIAEFKAGLDGRILFQDATGRTIALPFSLKGFTAAFASVK